MKRVLVIVTLVVVFISAVWMWFRTPSVTVHKSLVKRASTDYASNCSLITSLAGAKSFHLFEGLPHQGYERALLDEELRTKPTVRLGEFPFYESPLTVSNEDWERLLKWCSSEGSFRQWISEKTCGGFHPDYCVVATCDDGEYTVLICFGCHEILIIGPRSSMRCDMNGESYKPIETMLKAYRVNRPKRTQDD